MGVLGWAYFFEFFLGGAGKKFFVEACFLSALTQLLHVQSMSPIFMLFFETINDMI